MRTAHALNFGWKYSPVFSDEMIKKGYDDSKFQTVDIPHANKELPLNYFDEKSYQFVSCYRKAFDLKKINNSIVHEIKNTKEYGAIKRIISPNVYSGLYFFINIRIIPA